MEQNLKEYSSTFDESLRAFSSISLKEMNQAKLMNRLDNKYILNTTQLSKILKPLSDNFSILNINNSVNQSYTSFYYDTAYFDMYINHHNKRVNRYKIRQRLYNTSGDSFLEIKFKNNKGVTNKSRIETTGEFNSIPYKYFDFINKNSSYNAFMLNKVLENNFNRFTLTNKQKNQRITIDTNISFWLNNKPLVIPNLAIIEVKSTKTDIDKNIFQLLKQNHIHPTGMSKYCLGLAMLNTNLKQNLFKQKINTINKLCYDF